MFDFLIEFEGIGIIVGVLVFITHILTNHNEKIRYELSETTKREYFSALGVMYTTACLSVYFFVLFIQHELIAAQHDDGVYIIPIALVICLCAWICVLVNEFIKLTPSHVDIKELKN